MSGVPLANRRPLEVVEFDFNGFRYRGGFGEAGRESLTTRLRLSLVALLLRGSFTGPRELWLTPDAKSGTAVEAISADLAVVASLALRHGCPIETLKDALAKDGKGAPAGPLGQLLDRMEGV